MDLEVTIELQSPLQLSSGAADINVDTDILMDEWGLPFIPEKRLRGVLYESALEVIEILEGIKETKKVTKTLLDSIFNQSETESSTYIRIDDFKISGYESVINEIKGLHGLYPNLINKNTIREVFTSIRYQTAIDEETGVAKQGSLRNMRVVDKLPLTFEGLIHIKNGEEMHRELIALALQNLSSIGYKRNRGYGRIVCAIKNQENIVKSVLTAKPNGEDYETN